MPETMITEHEIEVRVRYQETDGQARVHHANYLTYFEMARTEMLRASGTTYRDFEETGLMLVVAEVKVLYYLPADYDDLLRVRVQTTKAKGARVYQSYEVSRGEEVLARGESVLACVDRSGRVTRLPTWLRSDGQRAE